jgi:hypothetical protein
LVAGDEKFGVAGCGQGEEVIVVGIPAEGGVGPGWVGDEVGLAGEVGDEPLCFLVGEVFAQARSGEDDRDLLEQVWRDDELDLAGERGVEREG